MFDVLKKMLGAGTKIDFRELLEKGAQIIDVRSPEEYRGGHIKSSVNIPLYELNSKLSKIEKDKAVITCCASGMRSASAAAILKSKGFTDVYNGGGWRSLDNKLH